MSKTSFREDKSPVAAPPPSNDVTASLPLDPIELFYSLPVSQQDAIINLILNDQKLFSRLYDLMLKDATAEAAIQNTLRKIEFWHFFPLVPISPENKIYIENEIYVV